MENMIIVSNYNNKSFAKCVKAINTALQTVSRNAWKIAEQYAKIKNEELWKDDFENETALCEHLGISRPQFSKMTRCVELIDNFTLDTEVMADDPTFITLKSMSVGQVSELLPLGANVTGVISDAIECGIDLSSMSCRDLREYVQDELKTLRRLETEDTEDTEETEETEVARDTEETEVAGDTEETEIAGDTEERFNDWIRFMARQASLPEDGVIEWLKDCPVSFHIISDFLE